MTTAERLQLTDRIPKDGAAIEIISCAIGATGVSVDCSGVKIQALSLVRAVEARGLIDELLSVLDWLEADCEKVME